MSHRWSTEDFDKLREMNERRIPLVEQAQIIGTTTSSLAQYRTRLGLNFAANTCIVCHGQVTRLEFGRKRVFCSAACINLLNAAYATNAYIDGRKFTNCVNCDARLIPPWSSKKKWCSRACGQRGWYLSSYYGGRKDVHYARAARSKRRRMAVEGMTQEEFDWLYTLRVDGDAPDYWVRKLRTTLGIASKRDLIRYARAVTVFA